ncbi:MAG: epimerase [Siphonobacter aquaeclarae]|nr:epimerase [Siphonobacter aquaeclarae]
MGLKVIITGTTGMVGEGVLLECLENPAVDAVLSISRRPTGHSHPKLTELHISEFWDLKEGDGRLRGYDACFFCAGVSSVGKNEAEFTRLTYDLTLHLAGILARLQPGMVFTYVSGRGTDAGDRANGAMWAKVKRRTEKDLEALPFGAVYHFRPAFMKATKGQLHVLKAYTYFAWLYPVMKVITPGWTCTLTEVGKAMIRCALDRPARRIIEVSDIKELAAQ